MPQLILKGMWKHRRLSSSIGLAFGYFTSSLALSLDMINKRPGISDLAASSSVLPLVSKPRFDSG